MQGVVKSFDQFRQCQVRLDLQPLMQLRPCGRINTGYRPTGMRFGGHLAGTAPLHEKLFHK